MKEIHLIVEGSMNRMSMKLESAFFLRQILLLLIVNFCFAPYSIAQGIEIKSFSMRMEPMTIPLQRMDNNGNVCALVKVIIPAAQTTFEGSLVGDCDFKTSEYWCYLTPGSKYLKVKYPGCDPLLVNFETLIGNGLIGKRIYELSLSISQENINSQLQQMRNWMNNIKILNPDWIGHRQGRFFPFKQSGKYGYLNSDFSVKIAPEYKDVLNSGKVPRAIDADIIHCNAWRRTDYWSQNFYWVLKDTVWGAVDENNRTIVPFKYHSLYQTDEDYNSCRFSYALVEQNNGIEAAIIDLKTGETIHTLNHSINPDYCRNRGSYSRVSNSRLLHLYTNCEHKNLFFDKYTGDKYVVKVPKGYQFRGFLPFNHLHFVPYDSRKNTEIVMDTKSNIILKSNWGRPLNWEGMEMSPQYLITSNGIFDLESQRYLFEKAANRVRAICLNNSIIDMDYGSGVHIYVDVINKNYTEELPNILTDGDYWMQPWQLAWNMVSLYFLEDSKDKVIDVIEVQENVCLVLSETKSGSIAYTITNDEGEYVRLVDDEISEGSIKNYRYRFSRSGYLYE